MTDLATLKAAVDDAEDAKADLIDERRANRETMGKAEFRAYNESTRVQQIETQRAVQAATKAFQDAATTVRSEAIEVAVGTLSETNTAGGAS